MMFSDSLVLVKEKWAIIFKLWSRSIDSPPETCLDTHIFDLY